MAKKPIKIKAANKGKLRAETKTPKGKKISASKLKKAAKSKDPVERKRAVFAENSRKWAKKKKS